MKQLYLKTLVFALFAMMGLQTFAYDVEIDGIYYDLNETQKTATVTYDVKFNSSYSGVINIPAEIVCDGVTYSVRNIGYYALTGCHITHVSIPNSVVYIGQSAFEYCEDLTDIVIPNSVTYIDKQAFRKCRGLNNVTLGNSLKTIERKAFYKCTALTSIIIPNSVEDIYESAFEGCTALTSIVLPNKNTYNPYIGTEAFANCTNLRSVISPLDSPSFLFADVFTCTEGVDNSSIVYETATLYVPIGKKAVYEETDGWKLFRNIVETDIEKLSGIADVVSDQSVQKTYYSLSGRCLQQMQKGLNIIRMADGRVMKVIKR